MIEETYNIWCENRNEFSELMKFLHSKGYKWASGTPALEWDPYFLAFRDDAGVAIEITSFPQTIRYGFVNHGDNMSFTAFMIKEGIKMDKFTKADLKDGMIMETRDGRYYMYFKKFNRGIRYEGYISIDDYTNNLSYSSSAPSSYDIVAVYSPESLTTLEFAPQVKYFNLIWERPEEEVVMTISEIEEKLGITNLKIVNSKGGKEDA